MQPDIADEHERDMRSSNFNWLRRDQRGATYIRYAHMSGNFASSFDFGVEGYMLLVATTAASSFTFLPHPLPKLLFSLACNRSTTLSSSLAQAQGEFGGPSTFGLEISRHRDPLTESSQLAEPQGEKGEPKGHASYCSFRPGQMIEHGSFNHRWPYHEYVLLWNNESGKDSKCDEVLGTYSLLSFVKDGYSSRSDHAIIQGPMRVVLTVGGDVWFETLKEATERRTSASTEQDTEMAKGPVSYQSQQTIQVKDEVRKITMDYQVYWIRLDGKANPLRLYESNKCEDSSGKQGRPAAYNAFLDFNKGRLDTGAVFVAIFRIRDSTDTRHDCEWNPVIDSTTFCKYICADPDTARAIVNTWETIFLESGELGADFQCLLSEANLISRCLVKILEVEICPTTFHMSGGEVKSLALVSNIFVHPDVDLKALL
ncbi:hypothetical protein CONLIGDRAFT_647278 [Coniochaeta ligniaria NRRL 30616]|uniref:Uncharacterized protein n=1 Tax=Coniochaeta ligniaria NRRL 30616 TaxID=1408157 RepID=A0A1J7IDH3_9PEZI|nr:hypothetical protein CONLIGDRAFT_647278 [Coniochaeta ligniaria NRRL 30616]